MLGERSWTLPPRYAREVPARASARPAAPESPCVHACPALVCFLTQARARFASRCRERHLPPGPGLPQGRFLLVRLLLPPGRESLPPPAEGSGSCCVRTSGGGSGLGLHLFHGRIRTSSISHRALTFPRVSESQWKANRIYLKSLDLTSPVLILHTLPPRRAPYALGSAVLNALGSLV